MKTLKMVALCTMLVAYAQAGKIITYTATSQESQEEANNAAIAGVAKQISAQVKVNQTLNKEEITSGKESSFSESFLSNSKVSSDIQVKGVVVKKEPAAKGFKATATLDLDEFTADIQFKMKSIQLDVTKLEETARDALNKGGFDSAIEAIEKAKPLPAQYNVLVNELGKVYPINESHRLKHDLQGIKSDIVRELSKLKFEGPSQPLQLSKPEISPLEVTVSNEKEFIEGFTLVAKQGRTVLDERQTQKDGTARFNIKNIDIDKGPFVIVIEPNLPEDYLTASGLRKKIEIDFKVSQTRCNINVQCKEDATICSALEKGLAKKSIFIDSDAKSPILKLNISTSAGKPIEYVPGKFTTPYDVNLSLKGDNITFLTSGHENGKREMDATIAVIKKINFTPLKKQLDDYCK